MHTIKKIILLVACTIVLTTICYANWGANRYGVSGGGAAGGVELVTDPEFNTACGVNWLCDAGWVISGGKANATATTGEIVENSILEASREYEVTFTVSNYVSGSVRAIIGTGVTGTTRSANGTYTERLTNDAGNRVQIDGVSAFTGSIDNVSVKQISDTQGADGFGISKFGAGRWGSGGEAIVPEWILADGVWDDNGIWDDAETWDDGV